MGIGLDVFGEHCYKGFVTAGDWTKHSSVVLFVVLSICKGKRCRGFVVRRETGEKGWQWKLRVQLARAPEW